LVFFGSGLVSDWILGFSGSGWFFFGLTIPGLGFSGFGFKGYSGFRDLIFCFGFRLSGLNFIGFRRFLVLLSAR